MRMSQSEGKVKPIRDFDADAQWVLETCEKQISTYSPPLCHYGRACLEKHWSLKENRARGFSIAHLLPFWLQETFDLSQNTCRRIALGNVFWLLYFFTQDKVMDASPGEYQGHLLPLGTLFFLDAIAPYRSLLGSDSPFWTFLGKYISEWAESVSWEREQHWGQVREFEEGDLLRLALKSAPLKIPCAALSLLAGREEAIKPLEEMIDNFMVVFQLADDLRDWREDLARGNYTYFLTQVMADRDIHPPALQVEAEVGKAFFVGTVFEEILELAAKYNQRATGSIATLHAPYLKAYIASLDQEFRQLGEGWQAKRMQWIREQFASLVPEIPVAGG